MDAMACASVFLRPVVSSSLVPSPAAAISGVMPNLVGIFGSAPLAEQRLIASASPALAARSSGVVPVPEHGIVAAIQLGAIRLQLLQLRVHVRAVREQRLDQIHAGELVIDLVRRRPVGFRHGVHVHSGVQRRAAGFIGDVRIRALIQQERRDIVMSVDHRHQHRADVVRIGRVDFRAGFQQNLRAIQAALPRGEQQRRQAAQRHPFLARLLGDLPFPVPRDLPGVHVRSVRDQLLRHLRMRLGHCPHQRRLLPPLLFRIDVRAVREQNFRRFHVPGARHGHQRRFAFGGGGVRIGARVQKLRDHRRASIHAGQIQRRDAIAIRGLHVGAGFESDDPPCRDRLAARPSASAVVPSGSRRIHIGVLLQQRNRSRAVAIPDGISDLRTCAVGACVCQQANPQPQQTKESRRHNSEWSRLDVDQLAGAVAEGVLIGMPLLSSSVSSRFAIGV